MEDEANLTGGILESSFKRANRSRVFPEPQSQDQIPTKRDSSRTGLIDGLSKLERAKTSVTVASLNPDQSNHVRKSSKSKTESINLITSPKSSKSPKARADIRSQKQTMFERTLSPKKGSLVSQLSGLIRKKSSIASLDPETSPINGKSNKKEFKREYRKSLINVAKEEIIECDDWNFDFGKIQIKFPLFMIDPFGIFTKIWNVCSFLLLLILLFVYSIRLCFELDFDGDFTWSARWLPFDIVFDLACLVDIIVNFLSAYQNDTDKLIISRKAIAENYLKKGFWADFLGLFPINSMVFQLDNVQYGVRGFNDTRYIIWRMIRLIKLAKLKKIYRQFEVCIQMFKKDFGITNILKFSFEIVIIVHMLACVWNLIGELELLDSWLDVEFHRYDSIFTKYLECVYFSLTVLLTVGYGNISANNTIERIALIIWMFFGVVVYAYIIGTLSSGFAKINQRKTSKSERELFYANFAKIFKLPFQLLDHILATIGTQYHNTNTAWVQVYETNQYLAELPKSLYGDICTHVYRELIEKIDFFQNKPKHFLVRILPLLKPNNLSYSEEVYKNGDPSSEVFFIHKGRIASVCHDRHGKIRSQIFVQGAYFGEGDILYKRARASTAYAESKVAMWKLDKTEFLAILAEFPDVKKEVWTLAKIKEMYRAPVAKKEGNKMKELLYAKKLVSNARNKRSSIKIKSEDKTMSPSVQKLESQLRKVAVISDTYSPSLVAEKSSVFSPDFRKRMARQRIDSGALNDSFQLNSPNGEVPARRDSYGASQTLAISMQKTLNSPVLAKWLSEKKKSQFQEGRMVMMMAPFDSDGKGSASKDTTMDLISPPNLNNFMEDRSPVQSDPEPKVKGRQEPKEIAQDKVKQKLLVYMGEKGISFGDYGVIDMLLKGKDSVVSSRDEFQRACSKTIEEIDQYADTEARIATAIGTYNGFLTDMMDGFRKKR